jgi:hypothetical protein
LASQEVPLPDPTAPGPPDSPESPDADPVNDFEKTLMGLYGDVSWSGQDKDFLRASGLI